ncbi:hypothetical protein GOEFS_054_00530 [Gordonia effusa NBRC 100432]|uniref:Uncharacterized protein n=1 Tax=Gordonia effusa NBRC 100432 TaxID=1077974 RepID=H0R038_9ACTN|nr:hypothetical protein [Gordonia effusa]GAB18439.1 hypothetical protein GOEFS_054_00530 [Gordonia effusa NBRC 100432]
MTEPDVPPLPEESETSPYRPSNQQWVLVGFIIAFGAGFLLYHVLKDNGLGQSAALYVGIPVVIAVVVTLTAPAKRPVGTAMKVTTILLLLSVPVLGEGACCVLLAAPLFYLFAFLAVEVVTACRRGRGKPLGPSAFVMPVLLGLLILEGTTPALTPPADSASTATRIIDLPASKVAAALSLPMNFDGIPRTGVLAIGFPTPRHDSGGLDLGTVRVIDFDGAHHRNGPVAQHHWGTDQSALSLRIAHRTADSVTFMLASDTSPLASWLRWNQINVSWKPIDQGRSEIRWQVHYTRLLSPSWYFGPIERLVTWRAADYLIRSINVAGVDGHPHHIPAQ